MRRASSTVAGLAVPQPLSGQRASRPHVRAGKLYRSKGQCHTWPLAWSGDLCCACWSYQRLASNSPSNPQFPGPSPFSQPHILIKVTLKESGAQSPLSRRHPCDSAHRRYRRQSRAGSVRCSPLPVLRMTLLAGPGLSRWHGGGLSDGSWKCCSHSVRRDDPLLWNIVDDEHGHSTCILRMLRFCDKVAFASEHNDNTATDVSSICQRCACLVRLRDGDFCSHVLTKGQSGTKQPMSHFLMDILLRHGIVKDQRRETVVEQRPILGGEKPPMTLLQLSAKGKTFLPPTERCPSLPPS